jgi:uncharacterized membrane protein (UPF0182 family)
LTTDEVYVASGLQEFSYPSDDGAVYAHYEGSGGVLVHNWLRRRSLPFALAIAISF